jgi:hypothetical protein
MNYAKLTALLRGGFDDSKHPRDSNGRFTTGEGWVKSMSSEHKVGTEAWVGVLPGVGRNEKGRLLKSNFDPTGNSTIANYEKHIRLPEDSPQRFNENWVARTAPHVEKFYEAMSAAPVEQGTFYRGIAAHTEKAITDQFKVGQVVELDRTAASTKVLSDAEHFSTVNESRPFRAVLTINGEGSDISPVLRGVAKEMGSTTNTCSHPVPSSRWTASAGRETHGTLR